jgi:hypothetical protein
MEAFDSVQLNKLSKVEKLRKSAEDCDAAGDLEGYCQLRAIAAENEARVYREARRRLLDKARTFV